MSSIEQMLEIIRLKSFIEHLALKSYASTKLSKNRYIKRLGTDSVVVDRRVKKPVHILD